MCFIEVHKKMKNKKAQVGKALGLGALVIGSVGLGALGGALLTPEQTQEAVVINATQGELDAAFKAGVTSVGNVTVEPVVITNTVEKEVVVEVEDTAFLQLVCDRAMFDDLTECKTEITAEDAALKLAIDEVKKDFARELYREGLITDDRRADLIRVYDDFDKIEVVTSDFDRDRYEFVIDVRVEDDRTRDRADFSFTVKVDNGEARIVDVE